MMSSNPVDQIERINAIPFTSFTEIRSNTLNKHGIPTIDLKVPCGPGVVCSSTFDISIRQFTTYWRLKDAFQAILNHREQPAACNTLIENTKAELKELILQGEVAIESYYEVVKSSVNSRHISASQSRFESMLANTLNAAETAALCAVEFTESTMVLPNIGALSTYANQIQQQGVSYMEFWKQKFPPDMINVFRLDELDPQIPLTILRLKNAQPY